MAELALECIGDDLVQAHRRLQGYVPGAWGAAKFRPPPSPYVAEAVALDGNDRPLLHFLGGRKDYSRANSVGSRGVYRWYHLAEGHVYKVFARESWTRSRTYWVTVRDGDIVEIDEAEVVECLSAD